MSANCINLTKSFLKNLFNICYTIIIPGNHDDNIRGNDTKIDSLSSIIKDTNYKNLFYFKETGFYNFNNISFWHMSVFDETNNIKQIIPKLNKKNNNQFNIALYHGMIQSYNQHFDIEYLDYKFKYSDFNEFDFVFLGDIHKHYFLNKQKTIAYPGSLIQLNYGEDITKHGGLIHWNLNDNSKTKFHIIPSNGVLLISDYKNNNFILIKFIHKILKLKLISIMIISLIISN